MSSKRSLINIYHRYLINIVPSISIRNVSNTDNINISFHHSFIYIIHRRCIMNAPPPELDIRSGFLNVAYLGTPDTLDSSRFPFQRSVYHEHAVVLIGHFRNESEYERWLHRTEEIRSRYESLKDCIDDNDISYEDNNSPLREQWLPLIDSFIQAFGKEMVPQDIRWTINNIQAYLDVTLTSFPPFLPCNLTPTLRGIDHTFVQIFGCMPFVIYWNHRSKIFEHYSEGDEKVYSQSISHLRHCVRNGTIRSVEIRNPIVIHGEYFHTLELNIDNVTCEPYLLLCQQAGEDGPAFTPYFFFDQEERDFIYHYLHLS
jgi:hypothetical protein